MPVAPSSPLVVGAGQTGGTIIVTARGKRSKILTLAVWKKILRLQREVKAEGFKAIFICPECQERIVLTVPSKTEPHFECACTEWIGR